MSDVDDHSTHEEEGSQVEESPQKSNKQNQGQGRKAQRTRRVNIPKVIIEL